MRDTRRADGIGFVLTEDDPFVCLDLDHCRDARTHEIIDEAWAIVDRFGSYCEPSTSGTGLHIIGRGTLPPGGNRCGKIEVYDRARYIIVMGTPLPGYDHVQDCQDTLSEWHREVFPPKLTEPRPERPAWTGPGMESETIIRKASTARNGAKFRALYSGDTSDYGSDDSRADAAFVGMLAFWTQDPEQIIEVWRSSGLYRAKTDREDYARRTVAKILDTYSGPYYDPGYRSTPVPAAPVKPEPTPDTIPDTYDEMTREELITTLRKRDAELRHERNVRYSIEVIASSDSFQAGPRLTAIGEVLHIADYQRRSINPTEHGYLSTGPQIAKRTGQTPKTVSGHLKTLNDKAGIGRTIVKKIADVESVDMDTGEIIHAGQVMQYGYVRADNVIDFAERVANYERTPTDPKHGGDRDVCPNGCNAGTITYSQVRCAECNELIIQHVTTQRPPKPSTHDGHTGGVASEEPRGEQALVSPSTQDGHTESVSIYLPKMGIRGGGNPERASLDVPADFWDTPELELPGPRDRARIYGQCYRGEQTA